MMKPNRNRISRACRIAPACWKQKSARGGVGVFYIAFVAIIVSICSLYVSGGQARAEISNYPEFTGALTSDDGTVTLESFSASWQGADKRELIVEASESRDNNINVTANISFALSGEKTYAPGDIIIEIPYKLFSDRNGMLTGTAAPAIPLAPSTSSSSNFSYSIDETHNIIIITNYNQISDAPRVSIGTQYTTHPAYTDEIIDMQAFPFKASLVIKNNGENVIETTSQQIDCRIDTQAILKSIAPNGNGISYNFKDHLTTEWNDAWGNSLKPNNPNEYIYVPIHYMLTKDEWSQQSLITVNTSVNNGAIVIGYSDWTTGILTDAPLINDTGVTSADGIEQFRIRANALSKEYCQVLIAVPKSIIPDNVPIDIDIETTATAIGVDDNQQSVVSNIQHLSLYMPNADDIPEDIISFDKSNYQAHNLDIPYALLLSRGMPYEYDYTMRGSVTAAHLTLQDGGDPSDISSYNKKKYRIEITDTEMSIPGYVLTPEDYHVANVRLPRIREYNLKADYLNGSFGYSTSNNSYDSTVTEYELYARISENDNWVKICSATLEDNGADLASCEFTDEALSSGFRSNSIGSVGYIYFPDNTNFTQTKLIFTTSSACIRIDPNSNGYQEHVSFKIQPSEKILEAAQKVINGGNTYITNKAEMSAFELDSSTPSYTDQDTFTYSMQGTVPNPSASKSGSVVNDVENRRVKISYSLNANLYLGGTPSAEEAQILAEMQWFLHPSGGEFITYDLLPKGAYLISPIGDNVKQTMNYKGSGRTLVEITSTNNYSGRDMYYDSITIGYDWDTIADYGNNIRNSVAYYAKDGGFGPDGRSDDGGTKTDKNLLTDLNGDGDDGDDNHQWMYADTVTSISVPTSAEMSLSKFVSSASSGGFVTRDTVAIVTPGEAYQYRIRFGSLSGTTTSDIILYDTLEQYDGDGNQWTGILESIDTSQPESKGIAPVIYYSTQTNIDFSSQGDVSDSSIWSNIKPTNSQEIKAIAIDLRYNSDGTLASLPENQTISVLLNMRAPAVSDIDDVTAKAYNNAYQYATISDNAGLSTNSELIHYDYTAVGFDLSAIRVTKLTTGNAPSDASYSFQLCDENGDPVNNADGSISSVDATGKFSLKSDETATIVLPAGDYIVKELTDGLDGVIGTSVKIGDDAEADGTKTDVITVGDGTNTDVTFTNEYPSASLRLLKVNKLDDTPLAGAEFKVTMPDASEKTLTSGGDGLTDVIENVMPGDYTIEETKLPDGVTDTGNRTFTVHVTDDGTVTAEGANVISTDTDDATSVTTVKVGNVKNMLCITKLLDGEVSKPRAYLDYSGIEFTLTNTSTHEKYTATTTGSGKATFAPLDAGTYELQETTGKVGYLVDATIYAVTVGTDGSIKVTNADDSNVNTVNKDGVIMTGLLIDNVSAKPSIEIVKQVNHELLTGSDATAGTQLTYTFTITNTGNVPLTNVTLTDELLDAVSSDITVDWKSGDKHLNVGETVTGTATYAITQDDVNAGEVVNDVSVTGHSDETDEDVTDEDTVTTTIESKPSISLEKSVSPSTFAAGEAKAGETEVTYTFTITNTGNVPLTNVTLDDGLDGLSDVSIAWASGDKHLNVSETVTGTATYTLTQADIDAGGVVNMATVDGTSEVNPDDTVSDEDDAEVQIAKSAELSIDKQVDKETLTGDDAKAGTQLGYTFIITNTGNVTLDGIDVVDEMLEDAGVDVAIDWSTDTDDASGEGVLLPGESVTARATYAITQDDVNAGKVDNTAHATGNDPDGEPVESPDDTVTTTIESVGAISIEKTVDKEKLTGDEVKVSTVLNYSFTIENTGNVTLTDVTLTDELDGIDDAEIDWSTSSDASTSDGTLSPNETVSGTATYAITQVDIDAGTIENVASVTGTTPDGKKPTDDDDATTVVEGSAAISLEKTSDPASIIEDDAKSGTTITYHFTIENIGDVTLTNVSITDVLTGKGLTDITYDWSGCASGTSTMAPGEKATATATYALTQADVDTGKVMNAATVNGTKPDGGTVDDDDGVETPIASKPSIDIVKAADQTTLDNPSAGDTVTYTFTVTNTGNVTLTDVSIADELDGLSGIAYDVDGHEDGTGITLAPGKSLTATATYHLTQDDIDAGGVDNTATVKGKTPSGGDVTDDDNERVDITADASLSIVKDVDRTELTGADAVAGAVLTYRFTIMNTGSVTVSDITVDDDMNGISGIKLEKTTLKPGETTTGTVTYKLTQADIDSGKVVNVARANGKSPDGNKVTSNDDDAETTVHADASIALEKTASTDMIGGDDVRVGYEITWYLTIRNTGNATVSDISVDDMLDGVSAIDYGDWSRSLAPGAERTVSATYAITQEDIEAGIVHNVAVSHGTDPYGDSVDSNEATKDVVIVPEMSLSLVKDVDKKTLSGDAARVGETLTYSFTITNTGDVQLTTISVDDYLEGVSGIEIDWSTSTDDASGDGTLNAGESVKATATYSITQDDIDAGSVLNTAIAHGVSGSGEDVSSNESTVQTVIDGMPSLSIVKTVDKTDIKDAVAGETLTYSFTVTNTGNVTLHDVNITDDLDGLSNIEYDWSGCASGTSTMLPGETATATATYDVTDADIKSGKVDNTATANGTDSGGDGVTSDPSTVSTTLAAPVPVVPEPKVEIPEPLQPIVEPVIEAAQQIVQTGVSNIGAVIGIGAAVIIGVAAYVLHRKSKANGEGKQND